MNFFFNLEMSTYRFSDILIKIKTANKSTTDFNKAEMKESIDFLYGVVVGLVILIVIIFIFLIYILIRIKNFRNSCALQQSNNLLNVFILKFCINLLVSTLIFNLKALHRGSILTADRSETANSSGMDNEEVFIRLQASERILGRVLAL